MANLRRSSRKRAAKPSTARHGKPNSISTSATTKKLRSAPLPKKQPVQAVNPPRIKKTGPKTKPAIVRRMPVDLPFSIPKDDTLKAIMEQNAADSPLLRLPLEIRMCIWGYVLGHQTIHIQGRESWQNSLRICVTGKPIHIICEATTSERDANELSRSASYDEACHKILGRNDQRSCEVRHRDCLTRLNKSGIPRKTLDLRMLRVCRRMYGEGSQIFWSTTLFSFLPNSHAYSYHAYTWHNFCRTRTPFQRQMIRRLHLGATHGADFIEDHQCLTKNIVSKFRQFDEVYIDFGLRLKYRTAFHPRNYDVVMPRLPSHFFRVKNVYVRCRGTFSSLAIVPWKQKVDTADEVALHLLGLQLNVKSKA